MTLSLYVQQGEQSDPAKDYAGEVGTNTGWGEFRWWAESLDKNEYAQVVLLAEEGWSERLAELSQQLDSALPTVKSSDLRATITNLLALLEDYIDDEGAVAVVTDGVGVEGEEEESSEGVPPEEEIDAAVQWWERNAPREARDLINARRKKEQ